MERPWLQFFTRDWLNDTELRRCSPLARSILADLMCLAHEGVPYGHLAGIKGAIPEKVLASRCVVPIGQFRNGMLELKEHGRVHEADGVLFIKRMVRDEDIRTRRAAGGAASVKHQNTPKKGTLPGTLLGQNKGYPSFESEGGVRSDSGSVFEKTKSEIPIALNVERWDSFVALWELPCICCERTFPSAQKDLAMQHWLSMGFGDDLLFSPIMAGLNCHRQSQAWHDGYVPSMAKWLGMSAHGKIEGPRWNDKLPAYGSVKTTAKSRAERIDKAFEGVK